MVCRYSYKLRSGDFVPFIGAERYGARTGKECAQITNLEERREYFSRLAIRNIVLGIYNGLPLVMATLFVLKGIESLISN